ncbi:MAG: argB [Gemmatimonadetes bacterium]|nr:argB [Gemmatimonadota bacterium]
MTRVIKIGGRAQSDLSLPGVIAEVWDTQRGGLVIVHGGGDEVSMLQKAFGTTAQFVGGRRVTTLQDLEIVRMALSGAANKRLVASLVREGVRAIGLSGEDASLIAAVPLDPQMYGYVGSPQQINTSMLEHLLNGGYLPVISPVSRNIGLELGPALNVNGDDAAAAIAVAMESRELLLVSDVEGVMREGNILASLTPTEARALLDAGVASGGMGAKLGAALAALEGGVRRVRITDIPGIRESTRGTVLQLEGSSK